MVFQQVLDEKILVKISNLREIIILNSENSSNWRNIRAVWPGRKQILTNFSS